MHVGIVGTGGMGNVHARHYKNIAGVDGIYAFDRDADKLNAFCKHHGAKPAESPEHLLSLVGSVDICLPTHRHQEFVLQALAAGVPTLVEKPMARTVEDCRAMVEASEKAGVPLGVAHVVRFFPEHELAHRLVKEGKVGTPGAVRMRRGGRAPVGSDAWFQDASLSGGVILDLAIHEFDWLRWTLGECTQVYARSVRLGKTVDAGPYTGDYALCTLSFESGAVAHVEATWMDPSGFRATIEVSGSEGIIEFDSRQNPVLRTHTDSGSRSESQMAGTDDPYFKQLSRFIRAIQEGTPVPVDGREGLKAVAIAEAAIESAQTGRPVVPASE